MSQRRGWIVGWAVWWAGAVSAPAQAPDLGDAHEAVPIGLVQGVVGDQDDRAGLHRSPLQDQRVTVRGIVYQRLIRHGSRDRVERGFFVQDTEATRDGDPRTSDGIFVYTQLSETVQQAQGGEYVPRTGDEILIAGRVREIMQMTHLHDLPDPAGRSCR